MRYVQIPHTELRPAVLSMGSICSVEGPVTDAYRILDMYRDAGGNLLDSANVYGKFFPAGTNICDIHIGNWLKSRGCRNRFIVETKGGHPDVKDFTRSRLDIESVRSDIEESLAALQTDSIDLFYLHRDDRSLPVGEIIEYLNDFRKVGLIRHFGCSNWEPDRICQAQAYAAAHGLEGFAANQLLWSMADADMRHYPWGGCTNMTAEAFDYHRTADMAVFAYESQARGFFQKYRDGGGKAVPENLLALYGSPRNIARYKRAVRLAEDKDLPLSAVILAYLTSAPFPSGALIGPRTPEQFEDSMTAADIELTPEEFIYLKGDSDYLQ
ncbi:aldo/keto reductase [Diplocloster modestus]|uniref:Aldo/keto reductase n=1 Tax=Diplocloster modestus TaxID=2850322 RepID=A0ABS6KBH9_9FIRM|nr:aldo/keto reductase [Diplocloster modestus]MBU9727856.1 aldo/keto reductase [Diplocloster modestus]